ncbi:TonB-dependent siderophore receptor [Burkholderia multivorans]|uniref:TonB-dependent receptor n=1 Tax=Burkholderia multivorans TaxID=87883 RepID=UPI00143E3C0D|nr:TonB-dependent siderophore receptor [Burkholderia multivorans]MBU9464645.1 TonB-dependent siderophore receptor [Burkholderia multivorans]MCA8125275.1 TonB-dependent siderophore receptor [Burkholderia multivorans]QIX18159.1 TonB-dependent siderophore receptor [Burkholderia multivorans]
MSTPSFPVRRLTPIAFGIALASAVPAAAFAQAAAVSAAAPASAGSSASAPSADGAVLPSIDVTGTVEPLPGDLAPTYAGGQVARGADFGVLGRQKASDVPFSMTTYTSKLIEDQQARTLADVLDNDPAVRSAAGYGNYAQVFVIRGFKLDGDDISLNGLYGVTPRQLVETDAIERVDVFKGANAFLNGASPNGSAVGGGVNVQLKHADDKPLTRVTVDGSVSGSIGTHVDVGRRFGSDGQFGIRVNQSISGGDTAVDDERRRNNVTAVSLDWRGDKLRVSGDFLYQRQRIDGGRPTVLVGGNQLPAVPSATHNYAQPWSFSELEDTVGIVRAEYDFLPAWTAYVAAGARHTNEHGDYYTPTYTSTGTTGSRLSVPYKQDAQSTEAGVRGRFATGPVTHFVTAGASFIRIESQSAYTMSSAFPTTLDDPAPVAFPATAYAGGDMGDPGTVAKTWLRSIAVSDTLGLFGDRVLFTIGARRQSISVDNFDYTGTLSAAYSDAVTTPVFGLVVKPWRNVSIFANRSEALAQGETAPSTARNAGQSLAPYRSKQYEAGIRYDADKIGASLALFQIEKPMAYTDPSSKVFAANGTQRHRGIETAVYGEPWKGVRLIAGVTYLDATLQHTAGGANDGNRPIGVPSFLLNAGAEYDVPMLRGLTLNARWIHTGPQYLDVANTISIPAWDRFDLGARYATELFGRKTTFRATVRNVANHAYWASTIGGYLTQGSPRSVWLSMTTDF